MSKILVNEIQTLDSGNVTFPAGTNVVINGALSTTSTIDGVDVSSFKAAYDIHTHDDRYYTETEIDALLTNSIDWDTAYSWGDHSLQSYATQTYVSTAIANLVDTAPTTLDTLNELAAALGDDPNFATTVTNSLATKAEEYTVSVISVNTTAIKDYFYIFTASLTLTLPASPSTGDKIKFSNMSGTTTPVIARNGSLIAGLAEDLTVDVDNFGAELIYTGAAKGWVIL